MKMSHTLLATVLTLTAVASSASDYVYWNQFGEVQGSMVNDLELQGTGDYWLTKALPNGSTQQFTLTVKGVFSEPRHVTYEPIQFTVRVFEEGVEAGWMKLTGYASEYSVQNDCIWSSKIDAAVTSGRLRLDPAARSYALATSSTVVLRSSYDICTGEEQAYIVGGQMVMIVP